MATQSVACPCPEWDEPLLSIDELCAWLGMSKSWVWERTRRDAIPVVRLGRYVRFRKSEIVAWIESGDASLERGSLPPLRSERGSGGNG